MDTSKNFIQLSIVQKKIKKIGLFDSGIGGLTIMVPLMQQFSAEYIYVADNRYMPYGNKTAAAIIERALVIVQFLIKCEVDLIIIACNAAYCSAYQKLQDSFPQITIVSIVDPIVHHVVNQTVNKRIGILATQATINSGLYRKKLQGLDKNLKIFEQPCFGLALSIEQGKEQEIDALLGGYVHSLIESEVDTVLLACTHYGLIINKVRALIKTAQVISIHEHTDELVTNLASLNSLSTVSFFLSNYTQEESEKIKSFFSAFEALTIASFNS